MQYFEGCIPVIQSLVSDGSGGLTVDKTYHLPIPNKKGLSLEWKDLKVKSYKTLGGNKVVDVYVDPTNRYQPVLTLKWTTYETESLVAEGYALDEDGGVISFQALLDLINNHKGGYIQLSPDGVAKAVRVDLSGNAKVTSNEGQFYADVELVLEGGFDRYPTQSLDTTITATDIGEGVPAPALTGGTGGVQRQTVTLTLSAATGTADLGAVFEVLDEVASAPGRFRLYRTVAGRDADLTRNVTTAEPNNVGLLIEDVFTASVLTISEDPAPCAAGSDGLCAWSWSGALGATITLDLLVKEA